MFERCRLRRILYFLLGSLRLRLLFIFFFFFVIGLCLLCHLDVVGCRLARCFFRAVVVVARNGSLRRCTANNCGRIVLVWHRWERPINSLFHRRNRRVVLCAVVHANVIVVVVVVVVVALYVSPRRDSGSTRTP